VGTEPAAAAIKAALDCGRILEVRFDSEYISRLGRKTWKHPCSFYSL